MINIRNRVKFNIIQLTIIVHSKSQPELIFLINYFIEIHGGKLQVQQIKD